MVDQDGDYQVRDYPSINIVTMTDSESGSSFKMLFKYITGANEDNEQIPMTTPVYMSEDTMAFVMPSYMTDVPVPTGDGVEVSKIEAGRWATIQYSGWANDYTEESNEKRLRKWINTEPEYSMSSAD